MINHQREPGDGSAEGPYGPDEHQRILELELTKIKKEAAATRLEARAAEIELLLGRLRNSSQIPPAQHREANEPNAASVTSIDSPKTKVPFRSWDEIRELYETATPKATGPAHPKSSTFTSFASELADDSGLSRSRTPVSRPAATKKTHPPTSQPTFKALSVAPATPVFKNQPDATVAASKEQSQQRKRNPYAWLVSAIAHAVLLLMFAIIGIQTQRPKDQVALSAAVAEAAPVAVETFSFEETVEPETEIAEPTAADADYELNPIGEIPAGDYMSDAFTPPATSSKIQGSTKAAQSLLSDSTSSMQFCGVEGGGNHFVYLVDSSKSMGDGFESARRELLRSVAVLKPDQRFYVVFFDAESDYMRLTHPDRDEPRSVSATPANKAALQRWAMRIVMDRGRAPYDAIRFALELKPDVIFLLSDGEFPQGIEDLLRERNHVDNLFGDQRPISIVHTIGYFSKEGETRMRRIAKQNNGQYRHIPRP